MKYFVLYYFSQKIIRHIRHFINIFFIENIMIYDFLFKSKKTIELPSLAIFQPFWGRVKGVSDPDLNYIFVEINKMRKCEIMF